MFWLCCIACFYFIVQSNMLSNNANNFLTKTLYLYNLNKLDKRNAHTSAHTIFSVLSFNHEEDASKCSLLYFITTKKLPGLKFFPWHFTIFTCSSIYVQSLVPTNNVSKQNRNTLLWSICKHHRDYTMELHWKVCFVKAELMSVELEHAEQVMLEHEKEHFADKPAKHRHHKEKPADGDAEKYSVLHSDFDVLKPLEELAPGLHKVLLRLVATRVLNKCTVTSMTNAPWVSY